jgi:hypothetical protein
LTRSKKRARAAPKVCVKSSVIFFFKSRSLRGSHESAGEFNIDDVISQVHEKMVRRHPHVFGETKAGDSAEVLRNWEAHQS